jgi:hypothetical protein
MTTLLITKLKPDITLIVGTFSRHTVPYKPISVGGIPPWPMGDKSSVKNKTTDLFIKDEQSLKSGD